MLATADCTNRYTEQIVYDTEWTESTPNGISWLNLLTAQPIPEETDGMDTPESPVQSNRESNCSTSSVESCYVVLEIQRPRSNDETSSKVEQEEEEEEEVEEVEIEELHFAQIKCDEHIVQYEQFAVSMTTEIPMEEYVAQGRQDVFIDVKEYAKVTEPTILQESQNEILLRKAKPLGRFTKRMKGMSYIPTKKEQNFSTSSDDEPLNNTKLKIIRKVNEYHPTAISNVTSEPQSIIRHSNSSRYSTTSLDSIENKSIPSSPTQPRITTTFSNLSSHRALNSIQLQRSPPTMGTTTMTRTFAFDRACMEKYGRAQEQNDEPTEVPTKPIYENIISEETKLPPKINEKPQAPSPPDNKLMCRSYPNMIPSSFYIGSQASIIDQLEFEPQSSGLNDLSKAPSLLCAMKKYARTVTSEYRLNQNNLNGNTSAEPTLLQVKYLDGRLPLKDVYAQDSYRKSQTLTGSIATRLNRIGISKMSSTQDLSSGTSFNISYRKRMVNRFRSFIENNSSESTQPPPVPKSRPWQHKTISELFHDKKYKVNHQR